MRLHCTHRLRRPGPRACVRCSPTESLSRIGTLEVVRIWRPDGRRTWPAGWRWVAYVVAQARRGELVSTLLTSAPCDAHWGLCAGWGRVQAGSVCVEAGGERMLGRVCVQVLHGAWMQAVASAGCTLVRVQAGGRVACAECRLRCGCRPGRVCAGRGRGSVRPRCAPKKIHSTSW